MSPHEPRRSLIHPDVVDAQNRAVAPPGAIVDATRDDLAQRHTRLAETIARLMLTSPGIAARDALMTARLIEMAR